jgi:hypothetical protein
MKMLNMTAAERGIPLPARPGTIWTTDHPANTCLNCSQSYDGHAAPEDVADELGIERSKRHLICPAGESAWEEYRAARRRVNLNEFVRYFKAELAKLPAGDRDEVLRQIVAAA